MLRENLIIVYILYCCSIINASPVSSCNGMLQCWLSNLTISLPPILVNTSDIKEAGVPNLKCHGVSLGNVTYEALPSPLMGYDVVISGVSTLCTGEFEIMTDFYNISTDLNMSIVDSSLEINMGVDMEVKYNQTNRWLSPFVGQCTPNLNFELSFGDDVMGGLLKLVLSLFKSQIEVTINELVCTDLATFVNTNLTKIFQLIDITVGTPAPYPPHVVIPNPHNDRLVVWNDVPIFHFIDEILNKPPNGLFSNINNVLCVFDKLIGTSDHLYIDIYANISLPIPNMANITLEIHSIDIVGLETLQALRLLHPAEYDNHTLASQIAMTTLNITISVGVVVDTAHDDALVEYFDIVLNISSLNASLDITAPFRADMIDKMKLGELFTSHGIGCLFHSLTTLALSLSEIDMYIDDLMLVPNSKSKPSYLGPEITSVLNAFISLITHDNNIWLHNVIGGIMRTGIPLALQMLIPDIIKNSTCPPYTAPPDPHYIHWNDSVLYKNLTNIINNAVGAHGINTILKCYDATSVNETWRINSSLAGSAADVNIHLEAHGFDTFNNFTLLSPVSSNVLDSELWFASSTPSDEIAHIPDQPFNLTVNLNLQYGSIQTQFNVNMSATDLMLTLGLLVNLDTSSVMRVTMGQLGSSSLLGVCIGSFFKAINMTGLSLNMSDFALEYTLTGGGGEINDTKTLSGANFTDTFNNDMVNISVLIGRFVNDSAQKMCHDAPYECTQTAEPSSSHHDEKLILRLLLIVVASIALLIFFIWSVQKLGARKGGFCSNVNDDDEVNQPLVDSPFPMKDDVKPVVKWDKSLLFHERVPFIIRWGIVVCTIGTIALFLWANLSAGASVNVRIRVGADEVNLGNLFTFDLANTVRDMWKAHVYPLSIFVAVFSGGWPYLKLVLMLFAMVLPRGILSRTRRETLLVWLDRLGKWSLIDTFVMSMFIVAFRFHVSLSDVLIADVYVIPDIGLYMFVLATMISLVLSHIILAVHRHTTTKYIVPTGGESEALCTHNHAILHRFGRQIVLDDETNKHRHVRCTRAGQFIVMFMVLTAMILLAAGVYEKTFSFEFRGLAGLILGNHAKNSYSVIDLGTQLTQDAANPDTFGVHWLQVSFFVLTVGFPALFVIVLLLLWIIPLTLQRQRQLLVLSEVSFAWASLDVFILSIVVATLQISQFAKFIIGDRCQSIDPLIAAFFDGPLHGDDVCFDLIASFHDGCWILFVSAVILILLGVVLGDANQAAVQDRLRAHYHKTTRRLSNYDEHSGLYMDGNVVDSEDNSNIVDEDDEVQIEPDRLTTKCEMHCLRWHYACNMKIYRVFQRIGLVELSS